MFRFLSRLVGLVLVAGGFILGVIDGTRSIADSTLALTPLGGTLARQLGARFDALQPLVERNIHPLLWDPVLTTLLLVPTAAFMVVVGFVFLWAGRPPEPLIGFDTKR